PVRLSTAGCVLAMVILVLTCLDRLEHARFFVRPRLTLPANPIPLPKPHPIPIACARPTVSSKQPRPSQLGSIASRETLGRTLAKKHLSTWNRVFSSALSAEILSPPRPFSGIESISWPTHGMSQGGSAARRRFIRFGGK